MIAFDEQARRALERSMNFLVKDVLFLTVEVIIAEIPAISSPT